MMQRLVKLYSNKYCDTRVANICKLNKCNRLNDDSNSKNFCNDETCQWMPKKQNETSSQSERLAPLSSSVSSSSMNSSTVVSSQTQTNHNRFGHREHNCHRQLKQQSSKAKSKQRCATNVNGEVDNVNDYDSCSRSSNVDDSKTMTLRRWVSENSSIISSSLERPTISSNADSLLLTRNIFCVKRLFNLYPRLLAIVLLVSLVFRISGKIYLIFAIS